MFSRVQSAKRLQTDWEAFCRSLSLTLSNAVSGGDDESSYIRLQVWTTHIFVLFFLFRSAFAFAMMRLQSVMGRGVRSHFGVMQLRRNRLAAVAFATMVA